MMINYIYRKEVNKWVDKMKISLTDVQDRFWDERNLDEESYSRSDEWYENGYSISDFI